MSWLAKSIANSLKFDDDDIDEQSTAINTAASDPKPKPEPDQSQQPDLDPQSPSSSNSNTPRGVKEDLTDFTKTLTRQIWGVASFLAPPPPSYPPSYDRKDQPEVEEEEVIAGIKSDFAEISGKFKTGISKLSNNIAVSEITKMASNFLQFGSEGDDFVNAVGVTKDVLAFARNIALHPETWLDFPVPDEDDFDYFDMSDAHQEHALAVERLVPQLAALRIELCPGHMSEGCFWKIYFVLLHPRLNKQDAELLSTSQILEARALLMHEIQSQSKAKPEPVLSGYGSSSKENAGLSNEEHLSVPAYAQSKLVPVKTSDIEGSKSTVAIEIETEKHPVQSSEMQAIDKSVVKEEPLNQTKHKPSASGSSKVLDEQSEDDVDDWLKEEEGSEIVGVSATPMVGGNDEDVSFSDLEEDDGDVPIIHKKTTSGSDSSTKDSRDWVQLGRSSTDSVKDVNSVGAKHAGAEQVSARNPEAKDSNDWLDVDDIDEM